MRGWLVTQYQDNGWKTIYKGPEDASQATFRTLAGIMGKGYLRLINPGGRIVLCVGRMDSLEEAIAALNEPVFFKVDD